MGPPVVLAVTLRARWTSWSTRDLRTVLDRANFVVWVTSQVFRKTVATRLDEAG